MEKRKMGSRYFKGYKLERSVRKALERYGCGVSRFSSSKPIDLVFNLDGENYCAECKNTTKVGKRSIYIDKSEIEGLCRFAESFHGTPIIVYSFYRQRPHVAFLDKLVDVGKFYRVDKGSGETISKFLDRERLRIACASKRLECVDDRSREHVKST